MNLWAIAPIILYLLNFNSSYIYHIYIHMDVKQFSQTLLPIDNTQNKKKTKDSIDFFLLRCCFRPFFFGT